MELMLLPSPDTAVCAAAALLALALDWAWGEPPAKVHPVVAIGHYLALVGRRVAPVAGVRAQPCWVFLGGACGWLVGAALVVSLAVVGLFGLVKLPGWAQVLVLGVALKPLLAWRMLRDEVEAVEAALAVSLDKGRYQVGRLVSRDVSQLNAHQVREAAISTLAENLNDSVVAPLFWYAVAGLPGAALYRFANTADAMWGYRGVRGDRDWTWAGKWAARADDLLSWAPARLTAVLIAGFAGWRNWRVVVAQAGLTPSPNGGWPMGALAVVLGIRLDKPGVYGLNPLGRLPEATDTLRALRRCGQVVGVLAGGATAAWLGAWL